MHTKCSNKSSSSTTQITENSENMHHMRLPGIVKKRNDVCMLSRPGTSELPFPILPQETFRVVGRTQLHALITFKNLFQNIRTKEKTIAGQKTVTAISVGCLPVPSYP